jgi:AcrR family transcriptional regulator
VSRLTVYNRFGSKEGLLRELLAGARAKGPTAASTPSNPRDELRQRIVDSCSIWSSDPALFRRLPGANVSLETPNDDRALAERLAAADQLRPGCSLKEAEDVIGALTSFDVFDRLHRDGRRSQVVVIDILIRLAAAILA